MRHATAAGRALLVLIITAPASKMPAADPTLADPLTAQYERVLQRYELQANRESLSDYLRGLHPNPESAAHLARLVKQLGSESYFEREAALAELQRLPALASPAVQQAAEGDDPEVRWRARLVLREAESRQAELLYATLAVIRGKRLTGLTGEVLATIPLLHQRHHRRLAGEALAATVAQTDLPQLRTAAGEGDAEMRAVIAVALPALASAAADAELLALLKDQQSAVRLQAARGLAERGRRESLPALLELLGDEELSVRAEADQLLRAVSGRRQGFIAYEEAEKRSAAQARWRKWYDQLGPTFQWKTPLVASRLVLGRTLATSYSSGLVQEFDAEGKEVWRKSVGEQPWGCMGLPNGHRLVGMYSAQRIVEFDAEGNQVWEKSGLPGGPFGFERLENGNTLIACSDGGKVVEVDTEGNSVWEYSNSGRPTDARRLANGNTLVALQNGGSVVEVDAAGNVAWQVDGLSSPFSAQRLEDGNTLITLLGEGKVIEIRPDKTHAWTREGLTSPYFAQRLENGNTLIATDAGVQEVDRDGKQLSNIRMSNCSRAHRY